MVSQLLTRTHTTGPLGRFTPIDDEPVVDHSGLTPFENTCYLSVPQTPTPYCTVEVRSPLKSPRSAEWE